MKKYIYELFLNKLEDIDNIIKLINRLSIEDKKKFLKKIIGKCKFTKEEFYSNVENKKIKLLCDLYENGILKNNEDYLGKLENTLLDISKELNGIITKKNLEIFLKNDKKNVIKK